MMTAAVQSPMSFTGAYRRMRPKFQPWRGAKLANTGLSLLLALWWFVVIMWYGVLAAFVVAFGGLPLLLFGPFRLVRRGQRRRRAFYEQNM